MAELREITLAEWYGFDWVDVTTYSDPEPVFIRGAVRTPDRIDKLTPHIVKTFQPYLEPPEYVTRFMPSL